MNPNQLPNYPRYTSQSPYNPPYNNIQNNSHSNQFNLNVPQNNQQFSYQKSGESIQFTNKTKLDRAMYSSTIQPSINSNSKSFGFGKLQSMGRFIGQDQLDLNKPKYEISNHLNVNHTNNYQQNREQQPKIQSYNSPKNQNEFDRFPAFNIQQKSSQQNFVNNMQPKQVQSNVYENETPQQKRKREILAIKKELQLINKKMQITNINKKYLGESNAMDKNINIEKNVTNNSNSGTSQALSTASNSKTGNLSNQYQSNYLGVGNRNKGLATQSMIVSNEPSSGYKYESLFDKYDSLKKPVYETTQKTQKQDTGGSLLDKFVGKGLGFKNLNPNSQQPIKSYEFKKSTQNFTQQPVKVYDFKKPQEIKPTSTYNQGNIQQALHTNNIHNNLNSGNNSSNYSPTVSSPISNLGSLTENNNESTGGGMFKKKKENPYTLEAHNAQIKTLITSPKNSANFTSPTNNTNFQQNFFKKTTEQNIVQTKMKEIGLEQSKNFKRSDFVVGKKLGKGQFGQVMLVQHKKTGFLCGMKVMQKKQIRQEKYEGQIARQLSIQFYLAHRNIAPLYGYFQDQANVYLLVQYCTGGQLLEMLRKDRRMEEKDVSLIIRQICQGVDYIHKELIIHRDIKPQNILFNFGVAKICDFGWAVYRGHGMRKTASGSPLYYSPEIVMGAEYDEKIDIWDIGMMTYQCLLGKIPFRIYSELDLNRIVEDEIKFPQYIDTTEQARDFILKTMKKKPEERMEIREMMRHPFITKYQQKKLPIEIMEDIKKVITG